MKLQSRHRMRRYWRLVLNWQVAVISAQVLPISWFERCDQFPAGLYFQRLAGVDLSHPLQVLLRDRSREHEKRPGEVWTIKTT